MKLFSVRSLLGASIVVLACGQGACDTEGFGKPRGGLRLTVELIGKDDVAVVGTRAQPLALSIDQPRSFRIIVRALDESGRVDPSFNGYVRISGKPGAIERIESADAEGRNLKLTNGESPETEVKLTNTYGATFIIADDLGYMPGDPLGDPPPACSNGVDDDNDGVIDFPADEGCAFANDDSEAGGSYAEGASPPIFYQLPRVADVRGMKCIVGPTGLDTCSGSGKTPYPKEQLLLDTGYRGLGEEPVFQHDLVVTRISSDGFYVTDTKDDRGGFNSIFSFNFNAPPRMRVCDRLKTFAGTATEFFGLTQISYPTWTLEEWDPQQRPCLVPEPQLLGPLDVPGNHQGRGVEVPPTLLPRTASLVRALAHSYADGARTVQVTVMVTPKFGPGNMPEQGGVFVPAPDATNCDFNKDGRIEFGRLPTGELTPENRCADACALDPECTEYSNYEGRSTFRLTISDGASVGAIQADATASAEFKPLERKGQQIKAFTGTLHFFSGGSQFTIEARCKDDIVVDLDAQPLPSDKACVLPRTVLDENPQ